MIRRDSRGQQGESLLLIGQIEHAKLAGHLAQAWGNDRFPLVAVPDVTIPTIFRHDDGWSGPDLRPSISIESHLPIDFSEIDLEQAHAIWTDSIDGVADLGPLAQYIVSAHFVALRRRGERAEDPESQRFVREVTLRSESWLVQWSQLGLPKNSRELAHHCLSYLQLFDALSLWLCRFSQPDDRTFETPLGPHLTVTSAHAATYLLEPWPFTRSALDIRIFGTTVFGRSFASQREFDSSKRRRDEISFSFVPKGD